MAFSQPRVPAALKTLSSHNYSPRGLSVSLSLGVSCNAATSNWKRENVDYNDDCSIVTSCRKVTDIGKNAEIDRRGGEGGTGVHIHWA